MTFRVISSRHRSVSLVLRPIDEYRRASKRPAGETGPLYPMECELLGRVVAGVLQPFPSDDLGPVYGVTRPTAIKNRSGDSVFTDLDLVVGTYRIRLQRDRKRGRDAMYENIDPSDEDIAWDPAVAQGSPPYNLVEIPLYPSAAYPFPPDSTLVRGSLVWYDGTPLTGAEVRDATALVSRSRIGETASFVLSYRATKSHDNVTVTVDVSGVSVAGKPQGQAYLNSLPSTVVVTWIRGTTVSVNHAALMGAVQSPTGPPVPQATVTVTGHPGSVHSNTDGRWQYHFPPDTPDGVVNLTIQHPSFTTLNLTGVTIKRATTMNAPTAQFS